MSNNILGLHRTCSRCKKRRKVNAYWPDKRIQLCKECSRTPDVAFAYSVRGR